MTQGEPVPVPKVWTVHATIQSSANPFDGPSHIGVFSLRRKKNVQIVALTINKHSAIESR